MTKKHWRERARTSFICEKQPATGSRGMVVTNQSLASAAGAEMLAAGGNAFDAAIAAYFTLTVVEPMMVGLIGGGMTHIRKSDGEHIVIDGMSAVPLAAKPDSYTPVSDTLPDYLDTVGRENNLGPKSVAAPGNLLVWWDILKRFGTFSLADVMQPAIKHAERGYCITPYVHECISDAVEDMAKDPAISKIFLPNGEPLKPGERLKQGDYAETLKTISAEGAKALHGGALGSVVDDYMQRTGGFLRLADLTSYKPIDREAVRGNFRGVDIVGPPPPSSGGVHVIQMLNLLEGFDVAGLGFGSADNLHLLSEVLKIAFADRKAATADPDFVDVPIERLIDKAYSDERRSQIEMSRAQQWDMGVILPESPNTTHLTVADDEGNIIAMTQTINSTFGARIVIPGTGMVPNNYMHLFDPHPGFPQSIEPGKRVTTSMSPVMGFKDGKPMFALGLTGGLRIFGSAMQAIVNLVEHGMSLQEAVEAPRLWTQGHMVEVETAYPDEVLTDLKNRGHNLFVLPHVGGGMNGIWFGGDNGADAAAPPFTGAADWRADGTPIGVGGGLAREGVRFWPDKKDG